MNILNYFKSSNLEPSLKASWLIGLIISIVSFVFILISDGIMRTPLLNSSGFNEFLGLYQFPIKTLTATVVLFCLWLTIERMKQTKEQTNTITDNNRFNNFYKHRDDFIAFYKNSAFYRYSASENKDVKVEDDSNSLFYPIYSHYYYPTFNGFEPKRNREIVKHGKVFIDKLKSSDLNIKGKDLLEIDKTNTNEVFELSNFIKSVKTGDPFIVYEIKLFREIYFNNNGQQNAQTVKLTSKVALLAPLFWRYILLKEIIAFDGEDIQEIECEAFEDNYLILCTEYNLQAQFGGRSFIKKRE